MTTVAGGGSATVINGVLQGIGDYGPATAAFCGCQGVTVDTSGDLFIADADDNRIRKVPAGAFR